MDALVIGIYAGRASSKLWHACTLNTDVGRMDVMKVVVWMHSQYGCSRDSYGFGLLRFPSLLSN